MSLYQMEASTMTPAEFRQLREDIGPQAEVADDLGCNRRSLGRWERGERRIPQKAADKLRDLAAAAKDRRARTAAAVKGMNETAQ